MPTLFAVYNLIDKLKTDEYDQYLTNTKIPGIRGAPWCTGFNTWKIDKVLAPAVSEPEGEMPSDSPYMYVAKIEVSDLEAMVSFLGNDEGYLASDRSFGILTNTLHLYQRCFAGNIGGNISAVFIVNAHIA